MSSNSKIEAMHKARAAFKAEKLDKRLWKIDVWNDVGWHFAFNAKLGLWRVHPQHNAKGVITGYSAFVDYRRGLSGNLHASGKTVRRAVLNALKAIRDEANDIAVQRIAIREAVGR